MPRIDRPYLCRLAAVSEQQVADHRVTTREAITEAEVENREENDELTS